MKLSKERFDIAAKELLLIQDVRQAMYRWHISLSTNDNFIGAYLSNLQDLAQELMFRSLNMSHNFITFDSTETGMRTVLAMIGNDTAISMGNVQWCMSCYRDFEKLWKALAEHDAEAIADIDKDMMYPAGNITNFPKDKIATMQSRALTDREIFDKIAQTVALGLRIDKEMMDAGLAFNFEYGAFGKHCINVENFLMKCMLMVLRLHGEKCVDDKTWSCPVHFTVFYPDEENTGIDVSTLDEDLAKLKDHLNNAETADKVWDAYVNFDAEAVKWLNEHTNAHVGPAEEDDHGET